MTALLGAVGLPQELFRARCPAALARMPGRGGSSSRTWAAGAFAMAASARRDEMGKPARDDAPDAVPIACDGCVYVEGGRPLNATAGGGAWARTLSEAFLARGPASFGTLEGSFALALIDTPGRRLFLVKDAFGTKPLYYMKHGGVLFFASEISGLIALSESRARPDLDSVDVYLSLGYVPAPATMLDGIRQLTPGHYLEIDEDGNATETPHRAAPANGPPAGTEQDWGSMLRQTLVEAIARRLKAHPSAGLLLSGGVDTAAVVAAAASRGLPLRTFTLVIANCPALDESRAARWFADKVGAQHLEIPVDERCLTLLDPIVAHVGAPVANPAALISRALCAQVGRHVEAVMCGDGGNEIFGGTYKYHQLLNHVAADGNRPLLSLVRYFGQKLWRQVEDTPVDALFQKMARRYFVTIGSRGLGPAVAMTPKHFDEAARFYAALNCIWSPRNKRLLYREDLARRSAAVDPLGRLAGLFAPGTADSLLQQVARVRTLSFISYEAMPYFEFSAVASGVTPLFPLLDDRLTELMFRLPYDCVFGRGYRHFMERSLAGTLMPVEIFQRPHKGFKPPLDDWFRTPLWRAAVDDLLSTKSVERRGLFSATFVRDLVRRHHAGQKYLATEIAGREQPLADSLWSLIALEAWFRRCDQAS